MLIFVDEAGDPGFKFEKHSSTYFTIGMVIFDDEAEAKACDQRIALLKRELKLPETYEFHYKKDSDTRKQAFLESIAPYDFFYYGITIDKKLLYSINFQIRETFYKYVCSLVFENAKEKIHNASVFVDGTYEKAFEQSFQKYLKNKMNINGSYKIKKVKMLDSRRNNLLQISDYIASGLQCEYSSKRESFMKLIKHREMYVQIRPKGKPAPIPKEDQPRIATGRS
jgi:DNA replicative helicase MCM subunit Mcm2 (Cdc46/Mcm family)